MSQTFETQLGGRTLTIETGKLARLAGGAVTVRYGDTLILGTANRSDPRPGLDFFPLTVEFEERMYAAGKIPGGFIKREARASEAATLAARLTDRPIRPLFPEGYKDDIQLVITVLSTDQENEPDVLGTIAASAALTISEIPFAGPVGAVRIGRIGGEFVVNPTYSQLEESELDLIVSGTRDAIMMVEAGAKLLPEDVMAEAILFGHRALQPLIDIQEQLREAVGKPKRTPYLEPGAGSVLDFVAAVDAKREFAVVDVETTGTDPKMSDLLEIGVVKVKGGKISDRWSTFVKPSQPDPRQPDARHHRQGRRQGAVARPRPPSKPVDFIGDALVVGHNVGLRPRLPRGGRRQRRPLRCRALPRHADHRPRGLSGPPELQAGHAGALLRRRSDPEPPRHAGRRGHRQPAHPLRGRPAGPDRDAARPRSVDVRPREPELEGRGEDEARRGPPRRPASARTSTTSCYKKTCRALALDEGIRMDGRGTTELRPISVEVGLLPRAHGSGLFTRGETQVLTIATLGSSSDVQRIDTISPKTEKKYIHHYNFPPYSDRREQADARPEPA